MRMCYGVFAVVLAACGGSNPTAGGGNPGPTTAVSMTDYQFSPETVTVSMGAVVSWSNDGTTDHTSTSDAAGGWNSNAVAPPGPPPPTCPYPPCSNTPGGSFTHTFNAPGTYPYHCAYHETLGMKGVVIVTP